MPWASACATAAATDSASWRSDAVGDHAHVAAGAPVRDQRLGLPLGVVGDARDGGLEDLGAAAEVAAEHDPGVSREPLAEREHVAGLRPAPAVEELIVVPDAADVAAGSREQGDEDALRLVGVLVFVDEQPPPALAVERQPVRVFGEQPHRVHEQVVEVEAVRPLQLDLGLPPHGGDQRRGGVPRRLLVAVGGEQPVLGQRDLGEHLGGRRLAVVGERLLDLTALLVGQQPLDHAAHVGLVIDGVVSGAPEHAGVLAEHARADRVERGGGDATRDLFAEQIREPQSQLAGRPHRERHREDLPRLRGADGEQPGDPVDQRLGLAGARAGDE